MQILIIQKSALIVLFSSKQALPFNLDVANMFLLFSCFIFCVNKLYLDRFVFVLTLVYLNYSMEVITIVSVSVALDKSMILDYVVNKYEYSFT